MSTVRDGVAAVRERIEKACTRSGRIPSDVTLIAVTKTISAEDVRLALESGIRNFGENYIQEALNKIETVGREGVVWHMIGHVQSNKARYIPGFFDVIHSIDKWETAARLDKYGIPLKVLFELNLAGETTKHGTDEDGLKRILERIDSLKQIEPIGLMTMAPYAKDPERVRHVFGVLRNLLGRANSEFGLSMKELSMGISSDFEVAVEEGATMVRVGTAIFGERS